MITSVAALACILTGVPVVEDQHLRVALSPDTHTATVISRLHARGRGTLELRLISEAAISESLLNGAPTELRRRPDGDEPGLSILSVELPGSRCELVITYAATFLQDVAAGERPGRIHNQSVRAHIGPEGVFLADGAAWHPLPIGDDGLPALHLIGIDLEPLEGWALVASGDPAAHAGSLDEPVWSWRTPRAVDGLAVAGGQHGLHGRRHETPSGPVDVVMQVPPEHDRLAPMFLDAACEYLDLYTPLLGPFPYKRFSIVENFFSSGFAYPGFTLLGPRVVAMAPRSLAPGYLDHELVHNWWGNGVYVDPRDGNWCEALTSFCANYFRRIVEGGEQAGLEYRRGILMKLSTDPDSLDDGPLGMFGRDAGLDRFVGYDKGAFFFIMLSRLASYDAQTSPGEVPWTSLRRFAEIHLGQRAGWADIQAAFEATIAPDRPPGWLDGMFELWVREHTVPRTIPGDPADARAAFGAQYDRGWHLVTEAIDGERFEIDPQFSLYRVLPPDQIIPTIAGTTGRGGVAVACDESRPHARALLDQLDPDPAGENLLIIGAPMIRDHESLLRRVTDPIIIDERGFIVGGVAYREPSQAVLHTMQHPDHPGRFITVFHSNGEAGWSRLRLVLFYTRDTTIVWSNGSVVARRVFEPDRRLGLR